MLEISNPNSVSQVVEVLAKGGLAVIPTDTVYGIAALGSSEVGREKLLNIKPRPDSKPISFLIDETLAKTPELEILVKLNQESKDLMAKHWPGALTLVFNKTQIGKDSEMFATTLKAFGGDTVGLRCPAHSWLQEVIKITGPLATTSANLHNAHTPKNLKELSPEIAQLADIICDGGELSKVASKVIDVTGEESKVLRDSALK